MKSEKLTSILREYYEGEISLRTAKRDIESASPLDIVLAELDLLDPEDGEELDDLKDLYLELAECKIQEVIEITGEGDPINRFVKEHEDMIDFVEELSRFSEELQSRENRILRKKRIEKIRRDVWRIRKHQLFEENTLFQKFRKDTSYLGVVILENEHEELDELLDELTRLLKNFPEDKGRIIEKIEILTYTILLNNFIENNFFYQVTSEEQKEIEGDLVETSSSDILPEYQDRDRKPLTS